MQTLLAMNINWEAHGHPGNYQLRDGTLLRIVNGYLDRLISDNNPYDGLALTLVSRGLVAKVNGKYHFAGKLTPARKRDLHLLPKMLKSLAEKNKEQWDGLTVSHLLAQFNGNITPLEPAKLLQMSKLMEELA